MTSRNSLMLASFIATALAAPLAFAQDASMGATGSASVQAQATPPATTPPATPATPATPPTDDTSAVGATPATAASGKAVNWSDLDADKDGKLSKTEAAPVNSLTKAFDKADADKDGLLSTDEYKAYLDANVQGH